MSHDIISKARRHPRQDTAKPSTRSTYLSAISLILCSSTRTFVPKASFSRVTSWILFYKQLFVKHSDISERELLCFCEEFVCAMFLLVCSTRYSAAYRLYSYYDSASYGAWSNCWNKKSGNICAFDYLEESPF